MLSKCVFSKTYVVPVLFFVLFKRAMFVRSFLFPPSVDQIRETTHLHVREKRDGPLEITGGGVKISKKKFLQGKLAKKKKTSASGDTLKKIFSEEAFKVIQSMGYGGKGNIKQCLK